jgi:hypothetical protein
MIPMSGHLPYLSGATFAPGTSGVAASGISGAPLAWPQFAGKALTCGGLAASILCGEFHHAHPRDTAAHTNAAGFVQAVKPRAQYPHAESEGVPLADVGGLAGVVRSGAVSQPVYDLAPRGYESGYLTYWILRSGRLASG